MNILLTYKEADVSFYSMMSELSKDTNYNVFVALDDISRLRGLTLGNCKLLKIPTITSKICIGVIKELRKIIKLHDIDIIFSPGSSGLSNALFASIGTKAKNIAYRGTQAKVKKYDPTYYLGIINPRISHVVCEVKDVKEYFCNFYKEEDLTVITKPYKLEWVNEAIAHPKKAKGIPTDAFKCIYIGSCENRPFKGLTDLINAFILLNDKTIHLTFIGDYGESDFQLAQKSEMANNIHFMGAQNDAIHYLPNQDLFILPSHRDASPRVIREAMACSVPCIVTDIPGARDLIINNKTGVLVPSQNPEALAQEIMKLRNNKSTLEAMALASRERIKNDFSLTQYVEQFKRVFDSVYNKR